MQDSERDNPSQPILSHRRYRSTDDASLEGEEIEHEPAEIRLPSHGLLYALIVGVLGGLIAGSIPVIVTLMNASLYHEASRLGDKMSYNLAVTITGLGCLGTFIDLLLSFIVGYIVGRIAVLRRRGLLAGALVGAITHLENAIVLYFPNYPIKLPPTTPLSSGAIFIGMLAIIGIFLIYSAIGGLIALWGAWTATRKHPYYQTRFIASLQDGQ